MNIKYFKKTKHCFYHKLNSTILPYNTFCKNISIDFLNGFLLHSNPVAGFIRIEGNENEFFDEIITTKLPFPYNGFKGSRKDLIEFIEKSNCYEIDISCLNAGIIILGEIRYESFKFFLFDYSPLNGYCGMGRFNSENDCKNEIIKKILESNDNLRLLPLEFFKEKVYWKT